MNRWTPGLGTLALCLGLVLTVSPTATSTAAIPPGYRVKMPRLVIDMSIAEGDLERDTVLLETPNDLAFHLPGTAIPGDRGNSYIYAHARQGMFLTLWKARQGDEVVIVAPDARQLRYVVSEVHPRVDPTDVSWAAPTTVRTLDATDVDGTERERPALCRHRITGVNHCASREGPSGEQALVTHDMSRP